MLERSVRLRSSLVLLVLAKAAAADPVVKVGGYVEAFYQLNFNQPENLVTAYRGFDDRTNSFTLSNAVLDVGLTNGPVTARVALQVGHSGASYYSAEPGIPAMSGTGPSDASLWRYLQQAYLGYQLDQVLIEAGLFLSPVGFENLPVATQWNYSRSDLFLALPFYHAGIRATVPLADHLTGTVYVINGWNDIVSRNRSPCFMGVANYALPDHLSVQLLYLGGVEQPTGAPEGPPWRHLFDATASWNVTPRIAVAAEADAGFENNNFGTSDWYDGAAYLRVQAAERVFFTARADLFHSHDAPGATRLFFPVDRVGSETLTAEVKPADALSVRLEGRHDHASGSIYFKGRGTAATQNTLTLGAVAAF